MLYYWDDISGLMHVFWVSDLYCKRRILLVFHTARKEKQKQCVVQRTEGVGMVHNMVMLLRWVVSTSPNLQARGPPSGCYRSAQNPLSSSLLSKNVKFRYIELLFCRLFCMGRFYIGRPLWGRNLGWGFSRTGCWGGYLGIRGTR